MASESKVWVISDTHFRHSNILKYEPARSHYKSIEKHDRDLVLRWNSVVRKKDTVWHLGDVFFGSKNSEEAAEILQSLQGYKRLVMGNHDSGREDVLREFFPKIYGVAEYGDHILSHIPVHNYQLDRRYQKNIHGHMHNAYLQDKRYTCVSVERINFTPILLQKAIQNGT